MDSPPILFIAKYQQVIDTKDITVVDELSDLEKSGQLSPTSLTQQKIKFIQVPLNPSLITSFIFLFINLNAVLLIIRPPCESPRLPGSWPRH